MSQESTKIAAQNQHQDLKKDVKMSATKQQHNLPQKRKNKHEKTVSYQEQDKEQRKRTRSELSKKRRLEKNRLSAKQSRVRKKHYQEEIER